jgi:hypothetical protein
MEKMSVAIFITGLWQSRDYPPSAPGFLLLRRPTIGIAKDISAEIAQAWNRSATLYVNTTIGWIETTSV